MKGRAVNNTDWKLRNDPREMSLCGPPVDTKINQPAGTWATSTRDQFLAWHIFNLLSRLLVSVDVGQVLEISSAHA
jgi:hypothetical protein